MNCNILTPTLLAITAFLSRSPGLLKRGPGGPASLGHVPQSSILSSTDWISCALSYIIVQRPPSSCGRHKSHSFNPSTVKVIFWYFSKLYSTRPRSRLYSDIPQGYILIFLDLLFTQMHFLFWQLGRVGGQYATITFHNSFPKISPFFRIIIWWSLYKATHSNHINTPPN